MSVPTVSPPGITPEGALDYAVLGDCEPCPRCLPLAWSHRIRLETVQPLPPEPPLGLDGEPCCFDCQTADNLRKILRDGFPAPGGGKTAGIAVRTNHMLSQSGIPRKWDNEDWGLLTFVMARVCVGNDRQEQLRLPGMPMGLAHPSIAILRPNQGDAMSDHHAWMDRCGLNLDDAKLL
jgi:hypothetical protein